MVFDDSEPVQKILSNRVRTRSVLWCRSLPPTWRRRSLPTWRVNLCFCSSAHQVQRRRPAERGGEEDSVGQGGRQTGHETQRSGRSRRAPGANRRRRRTPRPPQPRRHGAETQLRFWAELRAQRGPLLGSAPVRLQGSKPRLDYYLDSTLLQQEPIGTPPTPNALFTSHPAD